MKPMRKLIVHTRKKLETKPTFIIVMAKDIAKDIAIDIRTANKTVEYFLLIFT